MTLGSKQGRKPMMAPIRFSQKSAPRHMCLFSKVKSDDDADDDCAKDTPVYLNVYDLTPINGYVYWAGLGVFHSGVQVHGVEYAFGAHGYPSSGVFEVEPRECPGFKFRKSVFLGTTSMDGAQAREFMECQAENYNGDSYDLIVKNCNHFCNDICYQLTGKQIPKWVNRLAKLGSIFNCILPESLKITAVQHGQKCEAYNDGDKRRLRSTTSTSTSTGLSSISSSRQKKMLMGFASRD